MKSSKIIDNVNWIGKKILSHKLSKEENNFPSPKLVIAFHYEPLLEDGLQSPSVCTTKI